MSAFDHGPEQSCVPVARPGWTLCAAVATVIVLSVGALYADFWRSAPTLWVSVEHDRNGHYSRSQNVAFAIRGADLGKLIKEVHAATVWPPLHPLLTGAVLAVGGIDYRLAVLLSLAAWGATCWFAFALAYRLAPSHRALAGVVALTFSLASPAHRAYATDVMIESLGAALTLAILHFYVTARREQSVWRARSFGLLLTALFVTKYNYWTLLAAGLVFGVLFEFRHAIRTAIADWWRSRMSLGDAVGYLRHPLTLPLIAAFALAAYIQFVGPLTLSLSGKNTTIGTLSVPAQICFVLVLLRVLPWWRHTGRDAVARLPLPAKQLVQWHGYLLAVWFLWPKRLGIFIWYVTSNQHGRGSETSPWTGSASYYWQCLTTDYHAGLTALIAVIALVGLAVVLRRGRSTGALPVFVVLVVATLLTNYHSANRSRFLHSWIALAWVFAGVGAARVLDRFGTAGSALVRALRPALLVGALVGVVALQGPALVGLGQAEESWPRTAQPGLLPFADAAIAEIASSDRPVLVSNAPWQLLLNWRLSEYHSSQRRFLLPSSASLAADIQPFDIWLATVSGGPVLVIDDPHVVPPFSVADVAAFRAALATSGRFVLVAEWPAPHDSRVTVQVWRRRSG